MLRKYLIHSKFINCLSDWLWIAKTIDTYRYTVFFLHNLRVKALILFGSVDFDFILFYVSVDNGVSKTEMDKVVFG